MSETLRGAEREEEPSDSATRDVGACRHFNGHVIVCGLQPVGLRAVQQLGLAGARVVVLDDEGVSDRLRRIVQGWGVPIVDRGASMSDSLFAAGVAGAEAVICIESTDLRTLETVLLVRDLRTDVRLVAHLDNPAVARAVEEISGAASVVDVATLFAPSVVEACLGRPAHDIEIGEVRFTTIEVVAPRDATLRELYGSLVPLGVAGDTDQPPIVCPGRDLQVTAGDRVTLLGSADEMAAAGMAAQAESEVQQAGTRLVRTARRALAAVRSDSDRSLRLALLAGVVLLVASTLVLHFTYHLAGRGQHLGVVSAAYFTVETVATVGFGDFNFSAQSEWLEIYGIVLMVLGTTLVTTILALLTNSLVTRRIAQSLGQAAIPGMVDHVVMVGLGSVGMKVLDGLLERAATRSSSSSARRIQSLPQPDPPARGVPLVLGDSTLGQTLDSVNLQRGRRGGHRHLRRPHQHRDRPRRPRPPRASAGTTCPVVLRVFDRELGGRLEQSFGFRHVWSTAAIAAPWFVGAALGLEVLSSFYVGQRTRS